jgi:hypothetical protein
VPVLVALVVVVLLLALLVLLVPVLVPLSLVVRYRTGTSRQRARGWLATANVIAIAISTVLLLVSSAATSFWVPRALPYTLAGLAGGCLLGLLGLAWSRWETTPQGLHFTPNRWLVLAILLAVAARIGYGLWRAWNTLGTTPDEGSWLAEAGLAGSLAAGAVVVGYYLAYWAGIRRRYHRHRRSERSI